MAFWFTFCKVNANSWTPSPEDTIVPGTFVIFTKYYRVLCTVSKGNIVNKPPTSCKYM